MSLGAGEGTVSFYSPFYLPTSLQRFNPPLYSMMVFTLPEYQVMHFCITDHHTAKTDTAKWLKDVKKFGLGNRRSLVI